MDIEWLKQPSWKVKVGIAVHVVTKIKTAGLSIIYNLYTKMKKEDKFAAFLVRKHFKKWREESGMDNAINDYLILGHPMIYDKKASKFLIIKPHE